MPAELKDVQVLFLSLVDKGANNRTIIWKADNKQKPIIEKTVPILKVDAEKRMVYGIVYAPNEEDAHGDFMTAEEIEKAAHNFMKARRTTNIDKQHDYEADEGFVAESWIVRKGDPLFPNEPEGAWGVGIKVENDETWEQIKNGEITGISMGGFGKRIEKSAATDSTAVGRGGSLLRKFFKHLFAPIQKDFNSHFAADQLRQAAWALNDAILEILNDDAIADKQAAIKESINQFLSFLDEGGTIVTTNKNQNSQHQGDEPVQKDQQTQTSMPDLNEQLQKLNETMEKLEGQLTDFQKRLEAVEKTSPGKQSAEGRDDEDPQKVQKDYKGLPIL
ncbi:hypothetical protein Calab_1460 [Caldithrix abyssi DSM 13497]|uniref:Phage serine protease XkdF n=1 Tax=Caldithrix abyssi DSM 13497 TaxID=880073 RepID=H1XPV5_CALAY|nr:XkdF-like putative serine protease domain-containing protein [Caldithrix abyssi]APF20391.1 Putative phage serine protease XkdF [Caldithrix abyssi DSM 13497]EHO41081.1 hypothetical protein Calab_1460 [Caldithrix abyssi DSM 13497]